MDGTPEKRAFCAAAALNQHVFVVVGDYTHDDDCTYRYGTKTKTWTRLPNLKKQREWPRCVCGDEKVYAIGGLNDDDQEDEDSIEMLDLSVPEPSWIILPTRMKHGRGGCAAARR